MLKCEQFKYILNKLKNVLESEQKNYVFIIGLLQKFRLLEYSYSLMKKTTSFDNKGCNIVGFCQKNYTSVDNVILRFAWYNLHEIRKDLSEEAK